MAANARVDRMSRPMVEPVPNLRQLSDAVGRCHIRDQGRIRRMLDRVDALIRSGRPADRLLQLAAEEIRKSQAACSGRASAITPCS